MGHDDLDSRSAFDTAEDPDAPQAPKAGGAAAISTARWMARRMRT